MAWLGQPFGPTRAEHGEDDERQVDGHNEHEAGMQKTASSKIEITVATMLRAGQTRARPGALQPMVGDGNADLLLDVDPGTCGPHDSVVAFPYSSRRAGATLRFRESTRQPTPWP